MKGIHHWKERRRTAAGPLDGQDSSFCPLVGAEIHPHQAGQAQRARAQRDTRLKVGDVLSYISMMSSFDQPTPENAFLKLFKPKLDIVYEDEHILLVNKMPGMVVHADGTEKVNALINRIQAYLYQKKEESLLGELLRPGAVQPDRPATPAASSSPPRPPRHCGS